jgi:hypothetical protein
MRHKIALISAVVIVSLSSSSAYAQPPGGGQQGQFQELRKIFELMATLNDLSSLDKEKGLGFTKDQAKKFLPILKDIQTRSKLSPKDAEGVIVSIENILTDKQLEYMDNLVMERQKQFEERRSRAGQGQGGGFRPQGGGQAGGPVIIGPGGGQGGGQAEGFAMFSTIQRGGNPFQSTERLSKMLSDLVAQVEKKAK